MIGLLEKALLRTGRVEKKETKAVLWAAAYFFFLLSGYFLLRPMREQMGLAGGVRNLPWLFLITLGAMFVANPIYGAIVSRFPRVRFIPWVYRFFILNLFVFFALLLVLDAGQRVWVGRVFYVWVSVFNLFAVSVFWQLMADSFREDQGKRLYAYIGVGGTIGAFLGSFGTASLMSWLQSIEGFDADGAVPYLMIGSAVLLEVAVRCVRKFSQSVESTERHHEAHEKEALGGTFIDGVTQLARSPYLLGLCLYLFCYAFTSTVLYFLQGEIIDAQVKGEAARTEVFAWLNFGSQGLTLLLQLFLTSRLLQRAGVGITLGVLPVLTVVGLLALSFAPVLVLLVIVQITRKGTSYAVARPARETLFSVVSRAEKYKAKALVDTFVIRGGDAVAALTTKAIGPGLAIMSSIAVPLSLFWFALAVMLGKARARRVGARDT